jgi:hypothetical protein
MAVVSITSVTPVHVDSPHPVAVDLAQHGDAAGGGQKFKRIVRDQHPARHAVRQTVAQHQERAPGFFLGNQVLDLRQNIGLPGRGILRFLALLVPYVGNPYPVEIGRFGKGPGNGEHLNQGSGTTNYRELLRNCIHAG